MNYFKKKVKCTYCNKFHKLKRERNNKVVYLCSTYSNYGKDKCRRNKVDLDLIIECLSLRYGSLPIEEYSEKVEIVCVSEDKLEIIVKDGSPLLLTNTQGQF